MLDFEWADRCQNAANVGRNTDQTRRCNFILYGVCSFNFRSTFVQLSSHFVPFRPTFVQHSSNIRFALLQKHTGHGMQALLLPRKQQKRGGILCRKSGCRQMLAGGIETKVALPYLFRFAPFFYALFSFVLGASKFQFF